MNDKQLSKRLKTIASYIPPNSRIADIGSDHAYLPCYALQTKIASYAIAGEIAHGPYQSALNQVQKKQLTETIDVRFGNGLAVIDAKDNIDTIIIAGMGGALIRSILEKNPNGLAQASCLVLQPNVAANQIREWAEKHQWSINAESIITEASKTYEIIQLKTSSKPVHYSASQKLFGPHLMKDKNDIFVTKWQNEMKLWQKIVLQIANSANQTAETKKRQQKWVTKINLAKEVLK